MSKIQVFHLITRFVKGGADENTLLTVCGLDKKKYDISLAYGIEHDKEMVDKANGEGINTHCFELKHHSLLSNIAVLFQIHSFFKQNKFDIVHTHSTEAGITGRLAAYFAGIPIIIHTNHGIPFHQKNQLTNYFIIYLEKLVSKLTTKYISNADVITQEFLKKNIGTKEQYTTIYSGVDIDKFVKAKKTTLLDKYEDDFKILIVSRLVEDKGLEDVIQVADKLINENGIKDLIFISVGEGPLKIKLEKIIKEKKLEKNFLFLGKRTDVPEIMKSCNVLLLPSYREGTPRVITEAFAASLPVIASNIDGIPEQIEHNISGMLITPGNISEISNSIITIKNNHKLGKTLALKAKKKIDLFSKNIMIKKIDELYTTLTSKLQGFKQ